MTIAARTQREPLSLGRAHALNSAMVKLALEREGIVSTTRQEIDLLRAASLIDLAEAAAVVKEAEEREAIGHTGPRSVSMVCDDRLVAAIYAFLHFAIPPAAGPYDDDQLLVKMTGGARHWFLICGSREIGSLGDDDDEAEA